MKQQKALTLKTLTTLRSEIYTLTTTTTKNGALRSVQSTASQILHTRIYIIFLLQNLLKFLIVTSAVVGIHCRRAYRI